MVNSRALAIMSVRLSARRGFGICWADSLRWEFLESLGFQRVLFRRIRILGSGRSKWCELSKSFEWEEIHDALAKHFGDGVGERETGFPGTSFDGVDRSHRNAYAFRQLSLGPAFGSAGSADLVLCEPGGPARRGFGFGCRCLWLVGCESLWLVGKYLLNSLSERISQAVSQGQTW